MSATVATYQVFYDVNGNYITGNNVPNVLSIQHHRGLHPSEDNFTITVAGLGYVDPTKNYQTTLAANASTGATSIIVSPAAVIYYLSNAFTASAPNFPFHQGSEITFDPSGEIAYVGSIGTSGSNYVLYLVTDVVSNTPYQLANNYSSGTTIVTPFWNPFMPAQDIAIFKVWNGNYQMVYRGMTTDINYSFDPNLGIITTINGLSFWQLLVQRLYQLSTAAPNSMLSGNPIGLFPDPTNVYGQPSNNPYIFTMNPLLSPIANFDYCFKTILYGGFSNSYSTGSLPTIVPIDTDFSCMANTTAAIVNGASSIVSNTIYNNSGTQTFQLGVSVSVGTFALGSSPSLNAALTWDTAVIGAIAPNGSNWTFYLASLGGFTMGNLQESVTTGTTTVVLNYISPTPPIVGEYVGIGLDSPHTVLGATQAGTNIWNVSITPSVGNNYTVGSSVTIYTNAYSIVNAPGGTYSSGMLIVGYAVNDVMYLKYSYISDAVDRLVQAVIPPTIDQGQQNMGETYIDFTLATPTITIRNFNPPTSYGIGVNKSSYINFEEGINIQSYQFEQGFTNFFNSIVLTGQSFGGVEIVAGQLINSPQSVAKFGLKQQTQSYGTIVDAGEINRYSNSFISFIDNPIPYITIVPVYSINDVTSINNYAQIGDIVTLTLPTLYNQVLANLDYLNISSASFTARVRAIDIRWDANNGEQITYTMSFPIGQAPQSMYKYINPVTNTVAGALQRRAYNAQYVSGNQLQEFVQSYSATITDNIVANNFTSASYDIFLNLPTLLMGSQLGVNQETALIQGIDIRIDTQSPTVNTVFVKVKQPDGAIIYNNLINTGVKYSILNGLVSQTNSQGTLLSQLSGTYIISVFNASDFASPPSGSSNTYFISLEIYIVPSPASSTTYQGPNPTSSGGSGGGGGGSGGGGSECWTGDSMFETPLGYMTFDEIVKKDLKIMTLMGFAKIDKVEKMGIHKAYNIAKDLWVTAKQPVKTDINSIPRTVEEIFGKHLEELPSRTCEVFDCHVKGIWIKSKEFWVKDVKLPPPGGF